MSSVLRALSLAVVLVLAGEPRCCVRVAAAQSSSEAPMQIPDKIPDNQMPLSRVDRQIDVLGAESNIHSAADVETYINAILAKYKVDPATVPDVTPLAHRLAVAEYASLVDPSERIPEARIVDAFNKMMNEWGEEPWTRITIEDFHGFHRLKAGTLIPYSVSRNANGSVADSCRPVEAVYLLYLLSAERASQAGELHNLPAAFGRRPAFVKSAQVKAGPPASEEVMQRYEQYQSIRNAWLQSHFNLNPVLEIGLLFGRLHIGR